MSSILQFAPNVHNALWGSESWEISARPAGTSRIVGGAEDGRLLTEVVADFPLLIKVIEAKTRLSVQVHPNERTCRLTGGDPKAEMWCMLEDGVIYAGFKPGTRLAEVEAAVKSGKIEDLLVRHEVKRWETFFIQGGLIHAIGGGSQVYEVQQGSNTTFRLYDWNRIGPDGRPRQLQVEKALVTVDCSLSVPEPRRDVHCPFFDFRQLEVKGELRVPATAKPCAVFAAEGAVTVNGTPLEPRTSALVKANEELVLSAGCARVFLTHE